MDDRDEALRAADTASVVAAGDCCFGGVALALEVGADVIADLEFGGSLDFLGRQAAVAAAISSRSSGVIWRNASRRVGAGVRWGGISERAAGLGLGYRGRVTGGQLLNQYLAVIGKECGDTSKPRLARGQFHDVVLLGEIAYRFPRDEESRRLLPARAELLSALGNSQLPVAIPGLRSKSALGEPLGRCHVTLHRLSGGPLEGARIVGSLAEGAVVSGLARVLDRLAELGADEAIRKAVPRSDPRRWERFAEDVSAVLFPLMSGNGRERAEAELNRVLAVDSVGDALVHGDLGGANLLWATTELGPRLTGILDWDEAQIGNQADDLASIAVTVGWPLAMRIDAQRYDGDTPTISMARAIAATFALQQALPAALSGDAASLADGLSTYRDPSPAGLRRSLSRPRTVAATEGGQQCQAGRRH